MKLQRRDLFKLAIPAIAVTSFPAALKVTNLEQGFLLNIPEPLWMDFVLSAPSTLLEKSADRKRLSLHGVSLSNQAGRMAHDQATWIFKNPPRANRHVSVPTELGQIFHGIFSFGRSFFRNDIDQRIFRVRPGSQSVTFCPHDDCQVPKNLNLALISLGGNRHGFVTENGSAGARKVPMADGQLQIFSGGASITIENASSDKDLFFIASFLSDSDLRKI